MGSYFLPRSNYFFQDINALGNVTANIFIGNGALLTGVTATLPAITNIDIIGNVTAPGNITVAGQVNVVGNVSANYFIGNGALLTGVTATLPSIVTADIRGNLIGSYANVSNIIAVQGNVGNTRFLGGNVAVSGQINTLGNVVAPFIIGNVISTQGNVGNVRMLGGNVAVSGQINALGNVVAPFFIGNGSQLSGITSFTLPATANIDIRGNLIGSYANVANVIAVQGNVGNTRFLGGNVAVSGQINVLGNVVSPFFIGNGSQLSGIGFTLPAKANIDIVGNVDGEYANVANLTVTSTTIHLGFETGIVEQQEGSVAIGDTAGSVTQGNTSVAVGYRAGRLAQGDFSTAIGGLAGTVFQGNSAVAVGIQAGLQYQGEETVAVGSVAGSLSQGQYAVAIGASAGNDSQGANAVAIGSGAGQLGQGENSIAIGAYARPTGANTIILNATGTQLASSNNNVFIVKPVRGSANLENQVMLYDTTSGEVTYNTSGNLSANYFIGNGIFLSGITSTATSLTNGTSNVSIVPSGNITMGVAGIDKVITVSNNSLRVAGNVYDSIGQLYNVPASYMRVNRTTTQAITAAASNVIFTNVESSFSSDITANTSTGVFTLRANRTYRLRGGIPYFVPNSMSACAWRWYNATTSTYVGSSAQTNSSTFTTVDGVAGGTAEAIITPSVDTNVVLRVTPTIQAMSIGIAGTDAQGDLYPWADIQVIAGQAPLSAILAGNANVDIFGNVTAPGNIIAGGQVNVTGNIVGNYFIGNGSLLTGVTATANIPSVLSADIRGNLIGAYANVANIIAVQGNIGNIRMLGGNMAVSGQINTLGNVVAPFVIGNVIATQGNVGNTRFLGGNVAVSGQINVLGNVVAPFFIGNGSQLTGISASALPGVITADIRGNLIGAYANVANIIAAQGNVGNTRFLGGNVEVSGQINVLGNVVAPFFVGNGSQLTGITFTLPATANIDIIGNVSAPGNIDVAGDITATNIYGSLHGTQVIDIVGNVIDGSTVGAATVTTNDLFTSNVFAIGNVDVGGQVTVIGNVIGQYFVGNGALLTGITFTFPATGNTDIRGNLIGSYANVSNIIAVQGNVGNTRFLGGNVAVSGQINVLGNVVAPFFVGNGSQLTGITFTFPATGNTDIFGNLIGSYANVSNIIAVQGNVGNTRFLGGNVAVSGQINVLGNVIASFFVGNGSLLTGITSTLPATANIDIVGNHIGVFANVSNIIAVQGNVGNTRFLGGNVAVSGQVNVLGNVVAGNISSRDGNFSGNVIVVGNVNAGDGNFSGNLSVSGNCFATIISTANANILTVNANVSNGFFQSVIQATTLRGAVNTYSFLRLDNSVGRVLDIDGSGAINATAQQNSNVLTLLSNAGGFTGAVIQANALRGATNAYSFLRFNNSFGNILDVRGTGSIIATTPVDDNVFTINSTIGSYSNTLVYLSSERGITNAYSFMRCDAGNGATRVFEVQGTGMIISNCAANQNAIDVSATIGGYTSSVLNMSVQRTQTSGFNFINCTAGAGATTPFTVNGLGNITATGAMAIANTATFTCGANANVLTVTGTTLNTTGALIQGTSVRGNSDTYSLLRFDNASGRVFHIDGNGAIMANCSTNGDVTTFRAPFAAYTGNVLNLTVPRVPGSNFNYINCLANDGASVPFTVNGRGDINSGSIFSNTAINSNIFTVQSESGVFSNIAMQVIVPRLSVAEYSFINCRNTNGTLLNISGTGAINSTMPVNQALLNLNASLASFANVMILANVSGRVASSAFDYLVFDSPSGRALEVNGVGSFISNVFLNANGISMFNTAGTMTQDMIRLAVPTATGSSAYNFISCKNNVGNVFRVNGLGATFGVGTFNTSGADYAEMFEWEDGNTNDEDRRGTTVVIGNNGTIRIASLTDNPTDVVGVVSVNPSVLGDTKWNEWSGRFLRDKFGAKLSNTLYFIANVSNENERVRCDINDTPPEGYEKVIGSEFVVNPKYDPRDTYISREDRPEWSPIGLVGKLRVLPDQIVNPGWKLLRTIKHQDGNTLEYLVK